ncbi:MAG: cellulose synthase subunit BcsC-related outer membrane protein [Gallionellaceae bacterium]|nr:cellulose synthase subunit BcsC-related outer membrane protein [Gallionellaceae bacterium]
MFKIKQFIKLAGYLLIVIHGFPAHAVNGLATKEVYATGDNVALGEVHAPARTHANQATGRPSDVVTGMLLDKAQYWKKQGRTELAVSTWERILLSNPEQPDALAEMALYQAKKGQKDQALSFLGRLKQVNQKHWAIPEIQLMIKLMSQDAVAQQDAKGAEVKAPEAKVHEVKAPEETPEDRRKKAEDAAATQYYGYLTAGNKARGENKLDEAEQYYRKAMQLSLKLPEAPTAVADMLMDSKQVEEAEKIYRNVLGFAPDYPEAVAGLARVLIDQDKLEDALALVDKFETQMPNSNAAKSVRASIYKQKGELAEQRQDYAAAEGFYEKALVVQPGDPWLTFAIANVCSRQGKHEQAQGHIDKMLAGQNKTNDSYYAAGLFYEKARQFHKGAQALDQIPATERSEAISKMHTRLTVLGAEQDAISLAKGGNKSGAAEALSHAEAAPMLDDSFINLIINTWDKIGESDRGTAFLGSRKPLSADLQMLYATRLLKADKSDKDGKLTEFLNEAEANPDPNFFSADQKDILTNYRVVIEVRKVDALRHAGRVDQAVEVMAPLTAKYPDNGLVLLAQARLLAAQGKEQDARKIADAVLAREPGNHEAIRQGVVYSAHDKDFAATDKYLASAKPSDKDRGSLYLAAGQEAEAKGSRENAATYYNKARELGASAPTIDLASSPEQYVSMANIKHVPYFEVGYSTVYRGDPGLTAPGFPPSYYYEKDIPMAWHMPLEDRQSSLVFKANRIKLEGADIGPFLDLYGTVSPNLPPAIVYVPHEEGIALSAGYQSAHLAADFGISPIGFAVKNWVGGVRWDTDIEQTKSNVAIEVTRRSVVDSILSYAGQVDYAVDPLGAPGTGAQIPGARWGGVTKNGAQASIYHPFGAGWAGYASLGAYVYQGTNVANNSMNQMSMSAIYEIEKTDYREIFISLRLTQMHFAQNQNVYTFGNGGYYSPQKYVSAALPFHIAGKTERLTYEANLTLSTSSVQEDAPAWYPTNAALNTTALGLLGPRLGNPNNSWTGSWNGDWTLEYKLTPQLTLGNKFQYEHSNKSTGGFQQMGNMVFVRYNFDGESNITRFPPKPINPYNKTTQGGAGLN